jgi:predicted enzyme related to lactoylglutathione lyase
VLVPRRGEITPDEAVIAYVCTIDVVDLDDSIAKALGLGAVMALAKQAIPGIGWLAYVKDPEGNILGLMQNDAAAA